MINYHSLLALALAVTAVRTTNVSIAIGPADPAIGLIPFGSWDEVGAPGEFADGGARFLLNNADEGVITYTFASETTFEFWGYQRSDGALYSISFDGGSTSQIDAFNATSLGSDPPLRLFFRTGLTNAIHSVRIVNLFDSRGGKFGQMNIDHIVLTGNPPGLTQAVAPLFPANGFLAEGNIEFSYHGFLSLGADSPANGGSGATVDVLLDSGASDSWVIWSGCTENVCGGHHTYKESAQHFSNSSIQDTLVFSSGGEANTLNTWRVNDTLTFGNITVLSTTLGAAFHIPTEGEGLDGNFGIAKSFCAGVACASYPSFIEAMYEAGDIKSPVIAFYQLNSTDQPASGVTSKIDVGGLDRHKYIGSMDWMPVTQDSMWNVPSAQRFVKGAGATINATAKFTHTSIVFDTGDPGILGIPTNDWNTLSNLIGAQTVNGATLFPCSSAITFNFRGTQFRNYTYALVNTNTNNGNGLCTPTANDAGDTTNWISGVPFLDNYYVAFYYGNKGINSTIGFAPKNLAANAATAQVVIGSA